MAHPYASQAKASQARRLGVLGGKAGKSHGSSSMYKKTSYPSKNAGTERPMTISGGSSAKKYASGGVVSAGGGVKKAKGKPKAHSTTNIVIANGGRGGRRGGGNRPPMPVPVPVKQPVPVPVPAGGPGGMPPRPPVAMAGGPPGMPPGLPPGGPPGLPGMAEGGLISFKNGGSVKLATGGNVSSGGRDRARRLGEMGGPATDSDYEDMLSENSKANPDARDEDEKRRGLHLKHGGSVQKKALGGGLLKRGNKPGAFKPGAIPGQPPVVPLTGGVKKPVPGLGAVGGGMKKGGVAKKADGGFVASDQDSDDPGLIGSTYHNEGTGFNSGGVVKKAGAGSGLGRKAAIPAAAAVPAKTEL